MKILLFNLCLVVGCLCQVQMVQAQIHFGIAGGMITDQSTVVLQGRLEIGPESFMMSGAFNFVLDDTIDWAVDIDGHYQILEISDDVYLDVFPGINLIQGSNQTDIGLNLGASLRIKTDANVIFLEPKYTVGTYDSYVLTGGFIF